MAKKTPPAKRPAKRTTPEQYWQRVLEVVEMSVGELDETKHGRGDLILRDDGLEIHLSGFGVGSNLGEKLRQNGVEVRHNIYEKGATIWVCLFVKLESLPSRLN